MQHRIVSSRQFRRASALVAVTGALFTGACSDSGNTEPLVATNIVVAAGSDAQTGVVGQALAAPISVTITDQNGAPIANAVVGWTVSTADGTVSTPTSQTDASGNASVTWTLGTTAGLDSLVVQLPGGASTTITATAAAGGLSQLSVVSGDGQAVTAGSTTSPLVVKALDKFGNRVASASIAWSVTGGGSLSASTSVTDATGQTQVTLTTDPAPTSYAVTATSGGASVTFSVIGN
jgi:adhesin/invasin